MEYTQIIYSFIVDQIKSVKYIYSKDMNVHVFKKLGEEHYNLIGYPLADWECAYEWAMADTFNGGCEPETY